MPPCCLCSLIIPRPTLVRLGGRTVHWCVGMGGGLKVRIGAKLFWYLGCLRRAYSDDLEGAGEQEVGYALGETPGSWERV